MIKRIEPAIFSGNKVTAFFTESNRNFIHSKRDVPGFDLGFNTGSADEIIRQNYEILAEELGNKNLKLALARQVHATRIRLISDPGIYEETDGLITTARELALGMQVADCAAVLVSDESNGVIGAFHAGWRGAAGGIVPKGIEQMKEIGAHTDQMNVYISPCISLKNFEVGEEVARQFPDEYCDFESYAKPHVDLKGFITYQLVQSGIPREQIEVSAECTLDDERFYSYRRERERAGRMLALIQLNN
ncbi:MAG: peptidoglycan editing factor PgeF [Balneolaceae bacterium]|jgi:polyphenol oxidase|nr:peptidoglycan editing factor PgeF [Balneolaceae bacterium]